MTGMHAVSGSCVRGRVSLGVYEHRVGIRGITCRFRCWMGVLYGNARVCVWFVVSRADMTGERGWSTRATSRCRCTV